MNKFFNGKIFLRLIGVLLLLVILYLLDINTFLINLKKINPYYLIFAALLVVPIYLVKSYRWYFLLLKQRILYRFTDAILAFTSANFIAFITPGRVGEIAKAYHVKKDLGLPLHKSIPSVVLDRIFDVYFLALFSFVGIFTLSLSQNIKLGSIIVVSLLVVIPLFLTRRSLILRLVKYIFHAPILRKSSDRIVNFTEGFLNEFDNFKLIDIIIAFTLTGIGYLSLFISAYMISLSMQLDFSFSIIASFVAIGNIISFIPVSISGLGTREAVFIYLFSLFDESAEVAVLFSISLFFVFFVFGGALGYICFLIKPLGINIQFLKKSST
jgi:uncharacterized protein (TIRG00374 family)